MLEIALTAALSGLVFRFVGSGRAPGRFANLSQGLGREHFALTMLVLASHSRVSRSGAADTLSSPFTLETGLRGVFVMAAVVALLPVARTSIRLSSTIRRGWWGVGALILYTGAAGISVFYSPAFLQTAGKVFELAGLVLLVWRLMSRRDAADALTRTLYVLLLIELSLLTVSVLGFFLIPSLFAVMLERPGFFFRATLEGPLGSANDTSATGGMLVAVATAAWLSRAADRRSFIWPAMAVIGVASVALASGRQGVAIMVGAVGIAVLAANRQAFFLVLIPTFAVAVLFAGETILRILLRDQVAGSVATLTGRTVFWQAAIEAFTRQPLTGYGFGSSRFSVLAAIGADRFTHLHNGYLESLIGVGLIGFIPFMIAIGVAVRWCYGSLKAQRSTALAVILPALLAQNFIGQGFGGWLNGNLMIFALLVGLADIHRTAPGRGYLAMRQGAERESGLPVKG